MSLLSIIWDVKKIVWKNSIWKLRARERKLSLPGVGWLGRSGDLRLVGWFLNIDREVNTVHQLPSAQQDRGSQRTGRTLRMSVADRVSSPQCHTELSGSGSGSGSGSRLSSRGRREHQSEVLPRRNKSSVVWHHCKGHQLACSCQQNAQQQIAGWYIYFCFTIISGVEWSVPAQVHILLDTLSSEWF